MKPGTLTLAIAALLVVAFLTGVIGGGLVVFLVLRAALGTIHVASYERGRRDGKEADHA